MYYSNQAFAGYWRSWVLDTRSGLLLWNWTKKQMDRVELHGLQLLSAEQLIMRMNDKISTTKEHVLGWFTAAAVNGRDI
jgi:hypothetical protein